MGFFARLSVLVSACFPLSLVMQAAAWCSVGTVVSSCTFLRAAALIDLLLFQFRF